MLTCVTFILFVSLRIRFDAPWILNEDGEMIDTLTLYALKLVPAIFTVLGVKYRELTRFIAVSMEISAVFHSVLDFDFIHFSL